ncbi:MAG: hypothetical protein ACRDK9_05945 [Solirubrobacterales bacterium]
MLAGAVALVAGPALSEAGTGVKPPPKKARSANFEIRPLAAAGPTGSAYLRQKRRRLRGHVTVTGLEPGSAHDWHLIGPRGRCHRQVSRFAVSPGDDLVADANGVASAKLREKAPESVVRRGYYLLIQQYDSTGLLPPDDGGGGGILPDLLPQLRPEARHPGHPAHANPGIACGNVR